ncbi:MAG: hypothetical protein MK132_09350 [Lentisphaerales bacterium]|nr:hypothetical protein [Lentisphaerales bacterium]
MNSNDFIWWLDGKLIGGMMTPIIDPLRRANGRGLLTDFDDDLPDLYALGIRSVVSLINAPGEDKIYESAGFSFLSSPIRDFQAPDFEQCLEICQFIENSPKATLVTCEGGLGKTGTILTAWLLYKGANPEEALRSVRQHEPGAVESHAQLLFIQQFYEFLTASN